MGCCISKCRDHKHSLESDHQFNDLQDKLVISQAPPTSSNKLISNHPPSPTSSVSSFTCTTCNSNSNSNTLSSASSFSSSASSKVVDRSFSNEFLWSCYKENPHIINYSLKDPTSSFLPRRTIINHPPSPTNKKQYSPPSPAVVVSSISTPQKKRVRSNSPTNLTRQKSFRKEPVVLRQQPITINSASSNIVLPSSRIMLGGGSPSPSRRFNALAPDNRRTKIINSPKVSSSIDHYSASSAVSCSIRKEGVIVKAASPNNIMSSPQQQLHSAGGLNLKNHKETVVKDVMLSSHDNHMMMGSTILEEDIENPHISLDCFIFL